jgi:ABC-type nitrate/sulfonate/bicarbonate transport system ATPase subunit
MFLVTHDIDEALVLADRVVVLSGQPASIQVEIEVDLDRPRNRTDPAFHSFQDLAMTELSRSSQGRAGQVSIPSEAVQPDQA